VAKKHKKKPAVVGNMFSETNNGSANQLLVFNRYSDGHLKLSQTIPTGGKGGLQQEPGCNPPGGCPLLDAQGEVKTANNGKLVFAVNAGSNTIASFTVSNRKATFVGVQDSGGVFPNSVTVHGNTLYVLDNNSANIAGFTFDKTGVLTPIPGSVQSLTPEHAPLSRQIGFDNTGNVLVVSELTDATFDTFPVTGGVAGPAAAHPSASPEPFSFSFDPATNHLVSVEVVNDQDLNQSSNASSYSLDATGSLTAISTAPTRGYAACWTEITRNGRWVFTVNTGGPALAGATVTSMRLARSGALSYKSITAKADEFTLTDEALSRDDQFLYVVSPLTENPFVSPPPSGLGSRIITFEVDTSTGSLTRVSTTFEKLPPGVSGLDGV
jgi:6-phosphogluconolactonase (cycloisomerase 2 family)